MATATKELIVKAHGLIETRKKSLMGLIPKGVDGDRIICVLKNAISKNNALAECDPVSLIKAASTACEYGLEPNTPVGLAFIIPYNKQANFQIGYKGLIELAYRSSRVQSIYAEPVYKNDKFKQTLGTTKALIHEPAEGDRGPRIGCYAVIQLKDADPIFKYMTVEELEAHALRYSQAYAYDKKTNSKKSPWSQDMESATRLAMELKTVVVQASTFAPKSLISDSFARAVSQTEHIDITPGLDDIIDITANNSTEVPIPVANVDELKEKLRAKQEPKLEPEPEQEEVFDDKPSENTDKAENDPAERKQLVADINVLFQQLNEANLLDGKGFKKLCGAPMSSLSNGALVEVLLQMRNMQK